MSKQRRKTTGRQPRGEGSVHQRAQDGLWVGSIDVGVKVTAAGKRLRRRVTVYAHTEQECREKLFQKRVDAANGLLPDAGALTVGQYLARWLEAKKPTVAAHTYIPYKRDCDRYLTPHLGTYRLAELHSLHVQQLYADLTKVGVSAAMQKKAGTTLRVALQYAVHPLRLIPHNPAAAVKKPKHKPKPIHPYTPEQVARFLAFAKKDRLYALYVVALDSGAREGELLALLWSAVDLAGGAISITHTLEESNDGLRRKEVKTEKSRRRVAICRFSVDVLMAHRERLRGEGNDTTTGPVFCDTVGGFLWRSNVRIRSFRAIINRANDAEREAAAKAGREPRLLPMIRPYDLRHSSASLLLLAGEDSKVVAERLGHSTTRLTQDTYQHLMPGMDERAAAKLETLLRPRE